MAGGRPTKYKGEATIEAVQKYIKNYKKKGDMIPSIAGLACELGVARDTVHAWVADGKKPEFSDIITRLLAEQERVLLRGGLSGKFNPTITKLVMSKHDYHESTRNQMVGDGGGPVETQSNINFIPVGRKKDD